MAAPILKTWTREEYDLLARSGILNPDERLELVEGQIVQRMTHNPPHFQALLRTSRWLGRIAGSGYDVRPQGPIALSNLSEPEPDVVVALGSDETYRDRHPEPHEIALLVEVSHASIDRDRRIKLPLYAMAGIREVWIIDVDSRSLIVHREPSATGYRTIEVASEAASLSPLFAPEASVRVSELLPSS
jgi:Uma2 family endonuclease